MRTCPKCGELNGDNNTECYKCGAIIGTESYKKKCPYCGAVYNGNKDTCDSCGEKLLVFDDNYYLRKSYTKPQSNTWM